MKQAPLKRGISELKRIPIRKFSDRQKTRNTKYQQLRRAYLEQHAQCEFHDCPFRSEDLHHKAGRIGDNMFRHFMGVCRYHHEWIHSHTTKAREYGYILDVSGRE